MTPAIGQTYIGPAGLRYTVTDIRGPADGYQRIVIRREDGGGGRIEFPLHDAAKWLFPILTPNRTSAALGDSATPMVKKP